MILSGANEATKMQYALDAVRKQSDETFHHCELVNATWLTKFENLRAVSTAGWLEDAADEVRDKYLASLNNTALKSEAPR